MKKSILLIIISFHTLVYGQSIDYNVKWDEKLVVNKISENNSKYYLGLENAFFNYPFQKLPGIIIRKNIVNGDIKASIKNIVYEDLNSSWDFEGKDDIPNDIYLNSYVSQDRNLFYANFNILPLLKINGVIKKMLSFTIDYEVVPKSIYAESRGGKTINSVLKDGDIFKAQCSNSGIYKIDFNYLKNELKIDPSTINPKKLVIYGSTGGMLPEPNATRRIDDLVELPSKYFGNDDDGKFDAGDYILFYAEGSEKTTFNINKLKLDSPKNIYDKVNNVFIKINSTLVANRINKQTKSPSNGALYNVFDEYIRLEEDKINPLFSNYRGQSQGSGQLWLGDIFKNDVTKSYSINFPNPALTKELQVNVNLYASSNTSTYFNVKINDKIEVVNIQKADPDYVDGRFANSTILNQKIISTDGVLKLDIQYKGQSNNEGWLNYIEVTGKSLLKIDNSLLFRNLDSKTSNVANYEISNANSNTIIWDVYDIANSKELYSKLNGDVISVSDETNGLIKEYIAFNSNGSFNFPSNVTKISNQNLHGISNVELIIVYPKEFEAAAIKLKNHKNQFSKLKTEIAEINTIYNEFSSGKKDVTAIRDFAKLLYDRDPSFRYLLMLGDGSFDERNIYKLAQPTNFLPVYETEDGLEPIDAFPSDDYLALLSDNEGSNLLGDMDISIGRIPCKSLDEAMVSVDKVIRYESSKDEFGDWRLRTAFLADDEDYNTHINQSDELADKFTDKNPQINVNKIFFDSYVQESNAGGNRYPQATKDINNSIFNGLLMMCYLGHGGITGFAQERVLKLDDINSWKNFDKLPLIITATCTFSAFDNPKIVTAGERTFLNGQGGAIALYSTVRPVYADQNKALTEKVLEPFIGKIRNIGEIFRIGKNASGSNSNNRKFTLIGDPSMKLATQDYQVTTKSINSKKIDSLSIDTIKALQKVTITGEITDNKNIVSGFNGKIFVTIYDKATNAVTLKNDPESNVKTFKQQTNILFKGVASVKAGVFIVSCILPKDIDYNFGLGRISYYAEDLSQLKDASGYYNNIVIGGIDTANIIDDKAPLVELYLNDFTFKSGGTTDANPKLLVKLSDDNGINVSGNSVGHDLIAVLDQNTLNPIILNSFYESELNDYTKGNITYPLSDLADGKHSIKVRAWDISNNSGESFTEFYVSKDAKNVLTHVLNYPNPFSTNTSFQFEHRLNDNFLDISISIYSINGRLVKNISTTINPNGSLVRDINWDGMDDYGDKLANGVYIYKIKAVGRGGILNNNAESSFEKIVIIR